MSNRYKGAVISATPPTTTGGESGTASGAWTLEQQMQLIAAGLWPLQPTPKYIEDVFSTYLYTGVPGGAVNVPNGVDLSGNGGMVWVKRRNGATNHLLADTVRGGGNMVSSNSTAASSFQTDGAVTFNTNGFTTGSAPSAPFVSWTFREQPKFFDIVTYTGTGSARTVAHNLGSVPGAIFVKCTTTTRDWAVYHRSLGGTKFLKLNDISLAATASSLWNDTEPSSTTFTVGSDQDTNSSGATYVAYIFAHNAGGFGLTETDNVISCGLFTTPSSGNGTITLGYEPQWLLVKSSSNDSDWYMVDTMRAMSQTGQLRLDANLTSSEEFTSEPWFVPTATGFTAASGSIGPSRTFIYIAIRRGPMKVPTDATKVFAPVTYAGNSAAQTITAGFRVDMELVGCRTGGQGWEQAFVDRLRGNGIVLSSSGTGSEQNWSGNLTNEFQSNTGTNRTDAYLNFSSLTFVDWMFQRAPGFFDEVCYTGTGANTNFTHNLGVVPEMLITKRRSNTGPWVVYTATTGNTNYLQLYTTDAVQTNTDYYNSTTPTASVFTLGSSTSTNATAQTFVAYLFATCAGVSKVGSYTGTGTTLQIDCGFTAGSRFVLIKRTDSTGDWYVWDSARGIVAGNDPYLLLNSTAAEVTGTDYVDTYNAGFEISSTAPAGINASAGTYIFLAIA